MLGIAALGQLAIAQFPQLFGAAEDIVAEPSLSATASRISLDGTVATPMLNASVILDIEG